MSLMFFWKLLCNSLLFITIQSNAIKTDSTKMNKTIHNETFNNNNIQLPTCLKQIYEKCNESSECADFNGHTLICNQGVCTCSLKSPELCELASSNAFQPMFSNCSILHPCVKGHGFSSNAPGGWAEEIKCIEATTEAKIEKYAQCLTCNECKEKKDNRFNCNTICSITNSSHCPVIEPIINDDTTNVQEYPNNLDINEDEQNNNIQNDSSLHYLSFPIIFFFIIFILITTLINFHI